jgi:hypothetical protein
MKTNGVKRLLNSTLFCFYAIRSDIFDPKGITGMLGLIAFVLHQRGGQGDR